MVYGYVNRFKDETIDFLKNRNVDKVVYCDNKTIDMSFLKKGDKIILYELKSIINNLKDVLKFAQYVFDNEIEVNCADKKNEKYDDFIDTNTAMGRLLIDILAGINRLDNELYGN